MLELPASEASSAESRFDGAAWLSDGILLVDGRLGRGDGTAPNVALMRSGRTLEAACRLFDYVPSGETGPTRTLLMISIPEDARPLQRRDSIVIRDGDVAIQLSRAAIVRVETNVREFARERLAPLAAGDRARALTFLADSMAAKPGRGAISLSETLFSLRQALRERLPPHSQARNRPRGITVDSIMAVDDTSFYISGWFHDDEAKVTRFTAASPEGHRAELAPRMFTDRRPGRTRDPAEEDRFVCFTELPSPSLLGAGWILEMENAVGVALEAVGPPVLQIPVAVRNQILADASRRRVPDHELIANHVMPAMLKIAEQAERATRVESVTTFGEPSAQPKISIVIPLYKRIDLVEQQLAEFVQDPEMKLVDLMYVLDSPEQKEELLDLLVRLFPIYGVPLRVAVLVSNVGFANATNAGASIARGELLLLMNSDVFPDKAGWLSKLASVYESTPGIGALGPKLLYEDGSIQHAGMHFHKPLGSPVWLDAHFFRGLHRDFPQANVGRQVPLVSGACLMISRNLFEDVGGLQGCYVQGDYEDSDLCMRLSERGLQNWYTPAVELYHLEALSYLGDLRVPANRYNAWLHTQRWGRQIDAVEEAPASAGLSGPSRTRR